MLCDSNIEIPIIGHGDSFEVTMDPKQITALAKLLKDSGDKVLNCEYKLSLSGI